MYDSLFATGASPHLLGLGTKLHQTGETYCQALHNHSNLEILLISQGGGHFQIDGTTYDIKPKSLVIYNQGTWHEERTSPAGPHLMLYISITDIQLKGLPFNALIENGQPPVIAMQDRFEKLEQRFYEIEQEQQSGKPESEWICDHLLAALLAEIARTIHPYTDSRRMTDVDQMVRKLKHHIHSFYTNNITLQDLSQVAFLSPFHLSRLFTKSTGQSPIDYLLHYRIEVAKRYLDTTSEPIERIAQLVGYQSQTYFHSLFKKITGISPAKYRSRTGGHPK